MTFLPTPYTVGVHRYGVTGQDARGNDVWGYTPPLDSSGTQRRVYGWYVPSSTEPALAGHDRVVVDVVLMVPPGFPAGPHDRIDLPDGQYDVVGNPEDYNHGPFQWAPGAVVNLTRVEG
ncbi:hypothetical protein A5780_19215 [Nocardia sp. 852002-20019_SCH5090214]|uniref:hypothetical protein n=1 Tax=Nocardia sp. 852002-20019_SCH5090214 TaxID=1834087 RepID=UPI0007EBF9D7|nr:hypothetical protein [Nocardia sp. 852002-20019_SCH5090214]OBA62190.1 hypothetical protein A5780_19215 [Nocardia sp. 852002-20019_SCH5090214]